jgi:hypothetical protein
VIQEQARADADADLRHVLRLEDALRNYEDNLDRDHPKVWAASSCSCYPPPDTCMAYTYTIIYILLIICTDSPPPPPPLTGVARTAAVQGEGELTGVRVRVQQVKVICRQLAQLCANPEIAAGYRRRAQGLSSGKSGLPRHATRNVFADS